MPFATSNLACLRRPWLAARRAAAAQVRPVWAVLLALWAGLFAGGKPLWAQVAESEPETIRFRRVFVPEDRESEWPREPGVKYVPVPIEDFDRLVNLLNHGAELPESERRTRLLSAHYEARLNDQGVLAGTARFEIAHHQESSALLPLDPLSLAIPVDSGGQVAARWMGDSPRPARLGMTPDGTLTVLVTQSGTLELSWSLRGQSLDQQGHRFLASLPHCALTQCVIDLPVSLELSLGHGVLWEASAPEDGRRKWSAQLGAEPRLELYIRPASGDGEPVRSATVRQFTRYEISPLGIQISAQWSLDVVGQPLGELTLQLDPGVNLLEARQGDIVVQRSEQPESAEDGPRQEVLKFAAPLAGVGRSLRFTALAPLEIGQLQRLPTISAPGLTWREGEAVVAISPLLTLQHLETVGCRQSSPVEVSSDGEELRLQAFTPQASIELDVWYRTSRTQVLQGTAIQLTGSEIRGQTVVEFSQPTGERFELTANVPLHWTIDSLDTEPPGGIADWNLEPGAEENLLRIRLTRPITSEQSLRLTALGRWLESPVGQSLPAARLWMMRFLGMDTSRELLVVDAAAPDVLQFSQLPRDLRLDAKSLTMRELQLFDGDPRGTLLAFDGRARQVAVSLQRLPPRFQANISIDATVTPDTLWESCSLRIVPESGGLQRLLVQLSHAQEEPLAWAFASDAADDDIQAKRLNETERIEHGLPTDAEVWRLTWQRARTAPFEVRGSRSIPFNGKQVVSLIAVPEARQQQGEVHIWQFGADNVAIDGERLTAMYPDPVSPGDASLQRAAYVYDPQQHVSLAQALTLTQSSGESGTAKGLVWKTQLNSLCEPSGRAFHQANYWIENIASDHFRLAGLQGCEIESVELSGQAATWNWADEHLVVELPPRRRFLQISVQFSTRLPRLRMVSDLPAPSVHPADFPQMRTSWRLWLPPGYRAMAPGLVNGESAVSWNQRIFGGLARPSTVPPFDPFSVGAWEDLANSFVPQPVHGAAARREMRVGQTVDVANGPPAARANGQAQAATAEAATAGAAAGAATTLSAEKSLPGEATRGNAQAVTAVLASGAVSHPWSRIDAAGFPIDPTLAWQHFDFDGTLPSQVRVLCDDELQALGWCLLLALAMVIWWQAGRYRRTAIAVTGFVILLAAIAPSAWTPITTSLVQGALLGWGLHLGLGGAQRVGQSLRAQRTAPANAGAGSESSAGHSSGLGKATIALLLAALVATAGFAQEVPRPLVELVHKVFFPADDQGEIAGEYCFVPDSLYAQLHRKASRITREPRDWTLRQTSYRVRLQRSNMMGGASAIPANVSATLEFNVYRNRQEIRVDFGGGNPLRPTDAVLGSDTIPVRWEDGGRYLVFQVDRAGSHRLELQLRPQVNQQQGVSGFDLAIPRVPASRVEVLAPSGMPVEVVSAIGSVYPSSDSRPIVAELGPASRLALRWRLDVGDASANPFDASEAYWLTVKPGSVTLQTRIKLQFAREVPQFIRIAADPRLRLLQPMPDVQLEDPDPALPADLSARRQVYRIGLTASPLAKEATAIAAFVLRDTTGVGRLEVPNITVLGARTSRKQLAVSLDKSLLGRAEVPTSWSSVPPNLFMADFNGEVAEPPALAYRVSGTLADGAFWAEPRPADVAADQVTRISVGTGGAGVEFEASLLTSGSPAFRHRVKLPKGFQVEDVIVRENDTARSVTWSRLSSGWITVFLSHPAAESQKLIVRGHLPLHRQAGVVLAVPALELDGVSVLSDYVEFYQQQGVNVAVSVPLENAAGVIRDGRDRWLGRWWRMMPQTGSKVRPPSMAALLPPGADPAESPSALALPRVSASLRPTDGIPAEPGGRTERTAASLPQATMEVTPNMPRTQGTQAIWLNDRDGIWEVGVDLHLAVRQGRLDELAFDIPNTVTEPIDVSIEAHVELEDDDIATGRRRLVIRPLQSLQGQQHLTIFARLLSRSGQRLAAPDIRPLFSENLRRFLLLPTRWNGKDVAWQTQRLPHIQWPAEVPLPKTIAAARSQPLGYTAYRIQQQPFLARLQSAEPLLGRPLVTLADIGIVPAVDGSYRGVARFDLNPSGLKTCELTLPPGARLWHVTVANVPVTLDAMPAGTSPAPADGNAATPGAAGDDPSAIPAASDGPVTAPDAASEEPAAGSDVPHRWRIPLVSSRLVQRIEVVYEGRSTAGKLQAPQLVGVPVEQTLWTVQLPRGVQLAGASLDAQTESAVDLARARSISGVIAAVSYDESLEEMARWYQPWVQRFHHALERLRQSSLRDDDAEAAKEVSVLYDFQRDFARQLTLESYFEQAERSRPLIEEAGNLWQATLTSPQRFCAVVKGPAPELVLNWADPAVQRRWDRYQAGLAVLGVFALLGLLALSARRFDLSLASPQWLLVAAGVLWWLWLTPSVVGLILVMVSLLTTVPMGWKSHRRRGLLSGTRF